MLTLFVGLLFQWIVMGVRSWWVNVSFNKNVLVYFQSLVINCSTLLQKLNLKQIENKKYETLNLCFYNFVSYL